MITKARTSFEEGLKKTIEWYKKERLKKDKYKKNLALRSMPWFFV